MINLTQQMAGLIKKRHPTGAVFWGELKSFPHAQSL